MSSKALSIIIPVGGIDRLDNLKTCLHFLRKQKNQDFEIIIIEQETKLPSPYSNLDVDQYRRVKLPSLRDGLFNKNWVMNIGANMAFSNRFLFLDTDFIMDEYYTITIQKYNKPWFVAWDQLYYFNKEQSNLLRIKKKLKIPASRGSDCNLNGACGSAVVIDKEFFFHSLGGHNENYAGWGGDDNDGAFRASRILRSFNVMPYKVVHLYHPRKESVGGNRLKNEYEYAKTCGNHVKVTNRLINMKLGDLKGPQRHG